MTLSVATANKKLLSFLSQNGYTTPSEQEFMVNQLAMSWDPTIQDGVITLNYSESPTTRMKRTHMEKEFLSSVKSKGIMNRQVLTRSFRSWWDQQLQKAKRKRFRTEDQYLLRLYGPSRRRRTDNYRPATIEINDDVDLSMF